MLRHCGLLSWPKAVEFDALHPEGVEGAAEQVVATDLVDGQLSWRAHGAEECAIGAEDVPDACGGVARKAEALQLDPSLTCVP
jgi:hypothetical protein